MDPMLLKGEPEQKLWRYVLYCWPVLLFPAAYFPYRMWWIRPFGLMAQRIFHGTTSTALQLFFNGNNTILLFWCCVTGVVMVLSLAVWVWRIRPWYVGLLYMAVMFSLCGIFSLTGYSLIVSG